MCGIVGFINYKENINQVSNELKQAIKKIEHRGPNAQSTYYDKNIGFGHTRLAIIDLDNRSNQPMNINDFTIVFNGEIYNYIELKKELQTYNVHFETSSDTEVILKGYIYWGASVFKKLNGIFAISIYDKSKKKMILARDPLGVKPLYSFQNKDIFLFGSEIRSLLSFNSIPKIISKAGLASYLQYGSFQEPYTPVKNLKSIAPGTVIEIDIASSLIEEKKFENIFSNVAKKHLNKEKLLQLYDDTIIKQSRSDVKTTIFLSGGIDSTAILALMKKNNIDNISATSIIFDDEDFSEDKYIQNSVNYYDIEYNPIKITEKNIIDNIDTFFDAMDSPSIDGFNTYMISKKVTEAGYKVAFSGTGGDELFIGYNDFSRLKKYHKYRKLLSINAINDLCLKVLDFVPINRYSETLRLLFEKTDSYFVSRGLFSARSIKKILNTKACSKWDEMSEVDTGFKECRSINTLYSKISCFEFKNYLKNTLLKDADQFSMAHGLELRVPLLDIELSKYVLSVKDEDKLIKDYSKGLLTYLLDDILPPDLRYRKKIGFVFPFEKWMKNHLGKELEKYFYEYNEVFEAKYLSEIHEGYKKGNLNWARFWSIVVINRWFKDNGLKL